MFILVDEIDKFKKGVKMILDALHDLPVRG